MSITIPQPSNLDPCGICKHSFGQHYTTFDGKASGCAWAYEDQRDGRNTCTKCPGFALIYRYSMKQGTISSSAEDYDNT